MCCYIDELVDNNILHVEVEKGLIVFFRHGDVRLVYYRGRSRHLLISVGVDCKPRLVIFKGFDINEVDEKVREVLEAVQEAYNKLKKREGGG